MIHTARHVSHLRACSDFGAGVDYLPRCSCTQMRRVPVKLASLPQQPLRTAVVGPVGEELTAAGCGPNDPVVVLIHSFDSRSVEH